MKGKKCYIKVKNGSPRTLVKKRRRGRPCNTVLGLVRITAKSILTAGLSDN